MNQPAFKVKRATNAAEFTVSELSGAIKKTVEDGFGHVRLRGEISGYRGPHSSGHCYFALKDDRSKIEAVIWRGVFSKLKIKPEEGMEVIAQGRVTTYPNSSKYQIVIEALEPAGVGALMALLEERKKKFAAEGLFDEARKRKLPFLPRVVGIVTSPTGAVIRDMMHGFMERCPAHVIVWPARVQGDGSAEEIAAGIRGFNALPEQGGRIPRPDLLIVARGGGSLEDLWSFNEEVVVRAAAESQIPLISAVGHETDWTLIDLVADARAPTPTKAAEWAVPVFSDLASQIDELSHRLKTATRRSVEDARTNLRAAARGLPRSQDLIALPRQRFDAVERRLSYGLLTNTRALGSRFATVSARLRPNMLLSMAQASRSRLELLQRRQSASLHAIVGRDRTKFERVRGRLTPEPIRYRLKYGRERFLGLSKQASNAQARLVDELRKRLEASGKLLQSLSYQSVLERGFAVVRSTDGETIRSVEQVHPGIALDVEVKDGKFRVEKPGTAKAGEPSGTPRPRAKPGSVRSLVSERSKGGGGGQGSLF
ncbi:MAG: exodeoxyribonuclease VII large subunit [Pseudomonadota bacterium]